MAEFEDKLNSILGNQEAMSQIMALARSLSGEQPQEKPPALEVPGEDQENTYVPAANAQEVSAPDLSALLGQIDPQMLQIGMEVVRQVQSTQDRNAALLKALRPFLREERRARLDRALQIARMTKLIRATLSALGGKEGERV